MLGLMGRKLGMTQVFNANGEIIPVTVVKAGPCVVTQRKTVKTDGYNAIQIGFEIQKPRRMQKARRGHLEKKGLPLYTHLMEFRTDKANEYEVGEELSVAGFKVGDVVDVSGVTKGRGFQGVIKRHGKHGGPASHGSDFHRRPGSIGMRTWPGHVLKNMKLPGHMGNVNVTTKNLEVAEVRTEDNLIFIKGSIPGTRNGMIVVHASLKDFESREGYRTGKKVNAKSHSDKTPKTEGEKKE